MPPRPSTDDAIIAVQRAARRVGVDVRRHRPGRPEHLARLCASLGIETVVDVGANEGHWAQELRDAGYGGRIVSVEPLTSAYTRLAARAADDARWTTVQAAAGAEASIARLNIAGNAQSSSLLAMQPAHVDAMATSRYLGTEEVAVRRLDELLDGEVAAADRLLVKLDVQGFEDAALDGLGDLLDRVEVLQTEVSLVALYVGQPDWRELLDRLAGHGFTPFMVEPAFTHPQTGQTLQVDYVLTRRPAEPDGRG
jgi:FkbM family methyltransferase